MPRKKPPTFVFDFDSTLVSIESLDELIAMSIGERHEKKQAEKILEEIRRITDLGMNGLIAFPESINRRLSQAMVNRTHIKKFCENIVGNITDGFCDLISGLKKNKCDILIISGALRDCILPVATSLGIDHSRVYANEGIFDEAGILTGFREGILTSTQGKTACLNELKQTGVLSGTVVIVGDGISDLEPYRSGSADHFIGIGINKRRPVVEREAPHFFTSVPELKRHIDTLTEGK